MVRALPLTLNTPLATSKAVTLLRTHLRSLVASAYFEDERHVVESLISRAGLALDTWCVGAEMSSVGCVPLAVVGRAGLQTIFLDAWTVRRERMEAPAKRYWAWRMAMRPWDAFLAQVLQFQCQLHEILHDDPSDPGSNNPCEPQQTALNAASKYLRDFADSYTSQIAALTTPNTFAANIQPSGALFNLQGGVAELTKLRANIDGALKNIISGPQSRVLINGGIVELPSAGYLPVVPGTLSVNEQVRRLLGEGLDLRFCIVRPDYVPHALEKAQHMERISLLTGLDDVGSKPSVDILVPNGEMLTMVAPSLAGFDTQVRLLPAIANSLAGSAAATGAIAGNANNSFAVSAPRQLIVHGAGRSDTSSGAAFHFAGAQEVQSLQHVVGMVNSLKEFSAANAKKRDTILRDTLRKATDTKPMTREASVSRDLLSSIALQPNLSALLGNASTAIPKPVIGMWVSARSERDPFTLGVADSTPMNLELALTTQATTAAGEVKHLLMRVRAFATFSVTQAALSGASGLRMTGHMSGTYTTQTFLEDTTPGDTTKPFDVDVTLLRTGNAQSGTLRATLANPDASFGWIADASWGGTPLAATLKLSIVVGQKLQDSGLPATLEVLSANALASSDALAEGSLLRQLSTASLGIIGEELTRANQNGTAFVDVAERLLFPPPPPPVDDLTIRPTMDWVLFQRRRVKRCATPAPQTAVTPPRRYQLYTFAAKSQREVDVIRKALQAPADIRNAFQRVDVLEYASSVSTLVTPSDALIADWRAVQPGNTVAYAAAATDIGTDAAFTSGRLNRAVQGVSAISPFDTANGVIEVLPRVPASLDIPGIDGVIVLVTLNAVRTTCQNVYRVVLDEKSNALLSKNLLDQLIKMPQTTDLGATVFGENATALDGDAVVTLNNAWQITGAGFPNSVILFAKPGDSTGGDDATIIARGRSIGNAVGGTPNTIVEKHNIEEAWPVGPSCPVIAIVTVAPPLKARLARVVLLTRTNNLTAILFKRVPFGSEGDIVSFDNNALRANGKFDEMLKQLQEFIRNGTTGRSLSAVTLVTEGDPDTGAQARVEQLFKAVGNAHITFGNANQLPAPVVRASNSNDETMFRETSDAVSDLLVLTMV